MKMSFKEEKICRLCLKTITNGNFEMIDQIATEIFSDLLKMNLSISEEPVMCHNCSRNLQKSFDFKSVCMGAEDRITSFTITKNATTLDLNEVCLSENKTRDTVNSRDYGTCRFCMQRVAKVHCTSLEILIENMVVVKDMLPKCMPEMDLGITKDPILCETCVDSLELYLNFMMNCWDAEQKIKEYCHTEGINSQGQVNLEEVLQFILNINAIKKENCLVETGEEWEMEVKEEAILQMEDQKINIKSENEDSGFNSFQDVPFSSQPEDAGVTVYECEVCTYKTKRKSNLKTHTLVHKDCSELTFYKCEICCFETKQKYCLKRHMMAHEDPSQIVMYKCEMCPYKSKQKAHLKVHMLTHKSPTETKMYKCEACTYETKRKSHLNVHMLTHKDRSEVRMYTCEMCMYETKRKYNLEVHMLVHKDSSRIPLYKCELCHFETKQKFSLNRHMVTHKHPSEITKYKCELCTYETKQKSHVKVHMLIHQDPAEVTVYKCEMCTYKAKRKTHLDVHMLMHKDPSEIQMYTCDVCTYQAKRKYSLYVHMNVHRNPSKMTLYKCEICSFKTKHKYYLARHTINHRV